MRHSSWFPVLGPVVMGIVSLVCEAWRIEDGCGCGWTAVHDIVEPEERGGEGEGFAVVVRISVIPSTI